MNVISQPDTQEKIELLGQIAGYDVDNEGDPRCSQRTKADYLTGSIYHVRRSDGPMSVLRTLQTSACERNCHYCIFRAGRTATTRVTLSPDELAAAFDCMQRAGIVRGLFLSSGIIGNGTKAMDPMLATAELLRRKYQYRGYVHLKIMPGAERAQIEQAMRLANRVSINLEGVDAKRLAFLAPQKDFNRELLLAAQAVSQISKTSREWIKPPSLATQFVVGPAGESDEELLTLAQRLYRGMNLARAYYSSFSPIPDTPLEGTAATPPRREHRLYQADWLLRFYGFQLVDLPFDSQGALPQDTDPKIAWARQHLAERPVEVNKASRLELLRVPGIGPKSAEAIIRARRQARLRDLAELRKLNVVVKRAAPYVLLDGLRPSRQIGFWDNQWLCESQAVNRLGEKATV